MNKNLVLETVTIVCKEENNKLLWFLVKTLENSNWEFPHVLVRKGESSVRAALRIISQQANINAKVLEEVGRLDTFTNLNGKTIPKKVIYYLLLAKHVGKEAVGFFESSWCDYAKALKKLNNKNDLSMLKNARDTFKVWKKQNANYNFDEEEEFPKDEIEEEFQEEI
ncbi:MAG: NUDIX domain-containing protein [Patescibacteria group bacterium]|nr:NUDIX domain-containing protein [Patescibacteria group bacterium]